MKNNKNILLFSFVLFCVPFFLNDFSNIYVKDWRLWLFIDYTAVKLLPFILFIRLVKTKTATIADFGFGTHRIPLSLIIILFAYPVCGLLIDQLLYNVLENLIPGTRIGTYTPITNKVFDWIDLTFGLAMVAFFEELIFRGFAYRVISDRVKNPVWIIIISSTIFGLIHWSLGVPNIITAGLIGAVFMYCYVIHRNIVPLIIVHFLINFLSFAGILPPDIFDFILK
ncbi:MAG TPA: type II CAAX endopeptidase family protein [bacterium]|nr:type II CAAX endopeptidase family protein [bacterium]